MGCYEFWIVTPEKRIIGSNESKWQRKALRFPMLTHSLRLPAWRKANNSDSS